MKLGEMIKQERAIPVAEEAFLSIIVTSSWLMNELSSVMSPFGITPAQYNVLRILRGSHPRHLTCSAIGERLLDRTPDVTRLLNRLDRAGLISRTRFDEDRRVVHVHITEAGLKLLDRMQPIVESVIDRVMSQLTPEEQRIAIDLLDRVRIERQA